MSFATVGALVASRQPGNAIGWIFCYLGLTFPLVGAGEEYVLYALVTEPGSLPGERVWFGLQRCLAGLSSSRCSPMSFCFFSRGDCYSVAGGWSADSIS